jgi:hypothetical protein
VFEGAVFESSSLGRNIIGTVAPIPAAVCLFGSVFAALGWLRRKQTVKSKLNRDIQNTHPLLRDSYCIRAKEGIGTQLKHGFQYYVKNPLI